MGVGVDQAGHYKTVWLMEVIGVVVLREKLFSGADGDY